MLGGGGGASGCLSYFSFIYPLVSLDLWLVCVSVCSACSHSPSAPPPTCLFLTCVSPPFSSGLRAACSPAVRWAAAQFQ